MNPGISIILCCYNSVPRLNATIAHIALQNLESVNMQVILVDNASTDSTATYALGLFQKSGINDFCIVTEPESGLSNARRKGFLTAKYDFLLYCDDDNWLTPEYCNIAFNIMAGNSKIGILGGNAEAVFEATAPVWFSRFAIDFAVGEQSASAESLSRVKEVYGAGFVIRKSYLEALYKSGFKSILSDRVGSQLISGGDIELCRLTKYFGYEIWYSRNLKFKHFMPAKRMTWDYLKKLYAGHGKTNVYNRAYAYIETHNSIPGQNLKLPFWLDTFIHKARAIIKFSPKVRGKLNIEGNEDVLRFIAMKSEAGEIWRLKKNYSELYRNLYNILQSLNA